MPRPRLGPPPVAVIDIGSNSARVAVYERSRQGHLHLIASSRSALRLVRDVDRLGRLGQNAVERTLVALRDFRAIALGAGARRILAVATAALRDARNGPALLARVRRELGIDVHVIDGRKEARYGFLGAVHGLPVADGLLFDLGGGSMQVSRFVSRRLRDALSLPLGALRLSSGLLAHDPPTRGELRKLQKHVRRVLAAANVRRLGPGEALVGTGGTVRNLAKVDARARRYPVTRVHGYVLSRESLVAMAASLAARPARKRERVPGLSDERGDSIVGGAFAVAGLMEATGARELVVSGQGVREGVAYSLVGGGMPSARDVREASISALVSRFAAWEARAAERRSEAAHALWSALAAHEDAEVAEALGYAARILDIGRSVDFFDRYEHVAEIVLASELAGFSHRQVALLAAVVRAGREIDPGARSLSPILGKADRHTLERAGTVLALADDLQERCPVRSALTVTCRVRGSAVVVKAAGLLGWRQRPIAQRFEAAFGRRLLVQPW